MSYLLPTRGVLLVIEHKSAVSNAANGVRVIQRSLWGAVDGVVDGEVDVAEEEGLRASFGRLGVGVLGRSQQPEEGDNDEVNDVLVEDSVSGMLEIKGILEGAQDGDIDRVGSGLRIVFSSHGTEEISE